MGKRIIYKYPLRLTEKQNVLIPLHSKLITVKSINEQLYLYAMIDPEQTRTGNVEILIYDTGHELDSMLSFNHLETVVENGFVRHIFVGGEE